MPVFLCRVYVILILLGVNLSCSQFKKWWQYGQLTYQHKNSPKSIKVGIFIGFPLPSELDKRQKELNGELVDGVIHKKIDSGGMPNLGSTCYINTAMQVLTRFYGAEVVHNGKNKLQYFDYAFDKVQEDIDNGDAVSVLNAWNVFNALKMEMGGDEYYKSSSGGGDPICVLENIWKHKNLLDDSRYSVKNEDKNSFVIQILISDESGLENYRINGNDVFDRFLELYSPEDGPQKPLYELPEKLCVTRRLNQNPKSQFEMHKAVEGDPEKLVIPGGKKYKLKAFILFVYTNDPTSGTCTGNKKVIYKCSGSRGKRTNRPVAYNHSIAYVKDGNNWVEYNDQNVNSRVDDIEDRMKYAGAWFYDLIKKQ